MSGSVNAAKATTVNGFRADTRNKHTRFITTRTYRKFYNSYTMFLQTYDSITTQSKPALMHHNSASV